MLLSVNQAQNTEALLKKGSKVACSAIRKSSISLNGRLGNHSRSLSVIPHEEFFVKAEEGAGADIDWYGLKIGSREKRNYQIYISVKKASSATVIIRRLKCEPRLETGHKQGPFPHLVAF